MIISNLYKKVDPSWLPFFIKYFSDSTAVEFQEMIDFYSSMSTIFPKPLDMFKPFENISVDKVRIILYGTQPTPSPKGTPFSYSKEYYKQYETQSELAVRRLFANSGIEITPENMASRNILNLNFLPFTSSEIFGQTIVSEVDNGFNTPTLDKENYHRKRGQTYMDLITSFHKQLIQYIRDKNDGYVIILYNSGLRFDNIDKKWKKISKYSNPNSLTVANFLINNTYLNLKGNPHYTDERGKNIITLTKTSDRIFIFDLLNFVKKETSLLETQEDNFLFCVEESNINELKVVINYLIRKQFKNSNPIKW